MYYGWIDKPGGPGTFRACGDVKPWNPREKGVPMRKTVSSLVAIVLFLTSGLWGCSGGKKEEQAKKPEKPATERAKEAIQDYGRKPIDKARAAQQIGDERTKAIDEVTKQ